MDAREFISISQASQLTGLHPQTLRKYADADQIKYFKTPAGQRRFHKS